MSKDLLPGCNMRGEKLIKGILNRERKFQESKTKGVVVARPALRLKTEKIGLTINRIVFSEKRIVCNRNSNLRRRTAL